MAKLSITAGRDAIRDFAPKLVELTEEVAYADIWERPGLSKRDRSLITLASLVALGHERQMRGHIVRALANGVTPEEIVELVTHLAIYAGWPAAMTAAAIAKEVLEAEAEAE